MSGVRPEGPHRISSSGRWRGYVVDPTTGKRRYATGRTRAIAAARLAELAERIAAGVEHEGTVGAWLDRAVGAPARGGAPARASTVAHRRYLAGLVPGWLAAMPVERVRPADVERALAELAAGGSYGGDTSRSRNTVGRVRAFLSGALERAVRQGALARNPVTATDPVAAEKPTPSWLDVGQARQVLDQLAGHPWHALYVLLATVGPRRAEALGMRWQDLDLDADPATWSVRWTLVKTAAGELVLREATKTAGARRTVALPGVAADALRAHRAEWGDGEPFVWANPPAHLRSTSASSSAPEGLPHPDSLGPPLTRACKAAGAPRVTPHGLRHSAATIALAAGADSRAVMDLLGHDDPRMVAVYQHVLDEVRARTAGQLDAAWGGGG